MRPRSRAAACLAACLAAFLPVSAMAADDALAIVPDRLKIAADGADDAPSIQRAVDAICAGRTMTLSLLAHRYVIASPITQTCAARWQGQGWQEGGAPDSRGTWLSIAAPGFTPITLSGAAAAGSAFDGFGVTQAHPAPAPGWAPTPYPYVFRLDRTAGEVTLSHLMMRGVNQGITAFYSGRLKLTDIRGQWFTNAVSIDKSYDTTILDDIRAWPYWSADTAVLAYQQAHYDHIVLGRVDDAFIDRIFALAARATLKLVTTPAGEPGMPGGSPTNVVIGTIRSDFTRWTIWNTAVSAAFDDVNVSIQAAIHQGQTWGSLLPLPGSAVVRNDGAFTLMSIGYVHADFLDAAMVVGTYDAAPSRVEIGRAALIFGRSQAPQCYLLNPGGAASSLAFALPPLIYGGAKQVAKQPPGATGSVTWNTPQ